MREMVGGCCVCSDDRGWSENPLVYCDGQSCTVAVHQACYGIVTVPTGPWYCRKCESQERSVKVKCELCPSKYGALKRTDNGGWAHVVCALYIPEVRFGNVTTMEPIQLQLIPTERFNKVCYICEEKGKAANATVGACMQCNKAGCKQQFHVTCAQSLGLLCEEAGNYLDNVKYCGYCQHHYSKLKKGGNVKTIPPYKPISTENHLSDSNSEKEVDGVSTKTSSINKRNKSSSGGTGSKNSSSSKQGSSTKSSGSSSSSSSSTSSNSSQHQKTVHNSNNTSSNITTNNSNSKNSEKSKLSSNSSSLSSKSAKIVDDNPTINTNSGVTTIETTLPIVDNKLDVKDSKIESDQKVDITNGTMSANSSNINNNNSSSSSSSSKDIKSSKKRKSHSRTPTPVGLVLNDGVSVVTSASSGVIESTLTTTSSDKKTSNIGEIPDKPKKAKVETTQSILTNQPVVALTSISTIKSISHTSSSSSASSTLSSTATALTTGNDTASDTTTITTTASVTTTHPSIIQSGPTHTVNSLVVSVPLTSTSLSPHTHIINNQTSVVTPTPNHHLESVIQSSNNNNHHHHQNNSIIPSEMNNGGNFLKNNYEKQDAVITEVDMDLEIVPPTQDLPPIKRSHSTDKPEKSGGRGKKKLTNANGVINQLNIAAAAAAATPTTTAATTTTSAITNRRGVSGSRTSQTATPSPTGGGGGVFSNLSQSQLKDSPPSSPSSECTTISQTTTASTSGRGRSKNRKSAPASINTTNTPGSPRDTKDVKLFQNGVTAPHMLGNQLNPTSNMAQKMSDHLNSELEAHSIYNPGEAAANMVGPQLHHRVVASARASSSGASSTASGASGFSTMLSGGSGNIPQTLDQLLERQWEQGSQFLMEQAQHFDIASLLSCLHQLRAENLRLEEHVSSLLQRRDHLLAVNARLAIPLTGQPATPQSAHSHTVLVNNIHPAVGASHNDITSSRSGRHSITGANYPHPVAGQVVENGLPAAEPPPPPSYHRSPAPAPQQQQLQQPPQPSPSMRHSPAGSAYPTSGMLRQNPAETSGRSVPRPQPYPLYQTPGTSSSQQQMVIRRDSDMHYQTSKPS